MASVCMYETKPEYGSSGHAREGLMGNQGERIWGRSHVAASFGGIQQGACSKHKQQGPCPRSQIESLGINTKTARFPAYAVATVRSSSFQNTWTKPQKPQDLAKAGFFFAGYGDFVRCFFCGGGLTDWDPEDDPWVEHAHWFPECVFLLQNKGKAFVDDVQRMVEEQKHEQAAGCEVNLTEAMAQLCSPASSENYPTQVTHTGPSPLETIPALSVLEMGYSVDKVEKAIEIWSHDKHGAEFRAVDLMDIIFGIEDGRISVQESGNKDIDQRPLLADLGKQYNVEMESPVVCEDEMEKPNSDTNGFMEAIKFTEEDDVTSQCHTPEMTGLQEENRRLRDMTLCKICMDDTVSVAFLPCGHLATCTQCAPALRKCPICRIVVKGTVKTYLA